MLQDRYGNDLSTASASARDAYIDGVDRFLAAQAGAEDAFQAAITADPNFTLAHLGLARVRQAVGRGREAGEAFSGVRDQPGALTARESGHFNAFSLLLSGDGPGAYKAIRAHLLDYPRDAMIAQTCMGVFGMIGFSGQPGREAEQLAFTTSLAPHYGEDWWFTCQHGFAQVEAGQTKLAEANLERALELNPKNANAAHIRAHVYYEAGEAKAGAAFMNDWMKDYDKGGALHCHISWHCALWAMEHGDIDTMWAVLDRDIAPGKAWGPALNVMTDMASLLYRAELAGVDVPKGRWAEVSQFASEMFPNPGIAFGDVHAALAHAMAGNMDALNRIVTDAKGPAADIVQTLAEAFQDIAAERWADATARLTPIMASHERIGGSRAQRDLIEYAMLGTLLKQGAAAGAKTLLGMRRPMQAAEPVVRGLS
jgi:tetratricopeptide (TPR) repeat protein